MDRIESIYQRVERGEPIDEAQEMILFALEFARRDHEHIADALERERASDDSARNNDT